MSDLTGKTLGRYHVIERIGQGGMAEVYKGYQPSLDRHVAIKVMHAFVLEAPGSTERFQREARSVAALRHPNIVQVFDFDTVDNIAFMVMELIDGPNLKVLLTQETAKGSRLHLDRIADIMTAVGNALAYAHRWSIIHRDVKPHNIMFSATGQTLLTDFGVAKLVDSVSISDPSSISGTPAYMSPEQGRGAPLDRRTDIYSLGVVLYEMLTGRVPFDADTPFAVVFKHINDPLPPPSSVAGNIPLPLERVVVRALAKAPEDRYQTAEELVLAIQDAVLKSRGSYQTALAPPAPALSPALQSTPPLGLPARDADSPGRATLTPAQARAAGSLTPHSDAPARGLPTARGGRVKDDSVTIRLGTPEVLVESGGPPVSMSAVLTNPRQEQDIEQYVFEIADLDPAWYELDVKSVMLWRDDSTQVPIKFKAPRKGAEPGIYMYRVIARSLSDPEIMGFTMGRMIVSPPPNLQMAIADSSGPGATTHYLVSLVNGPVGGVIVELEGQDTSGMLTFVSTPPRVRLGSSEEATVDLEVGMKPGVVGEAQAYPFSLIANLTGGDEGAMPSECATEFIYVPPVQIQMRIEMEPLSGPLGDCEVVLTNPTSLTLEVDLKDENPEDGLDYYFHQEGEERSRLARESTMTMKGIVRVSRDLPTELTEIPYTLHAHVRNVDGPGYIDYIYRDSLIFDPRGPATNAGADPLAGVQLELDPRAAAGDPARYAVRLRNSGPEPVLALLLARDLAGALECNVDPPQVYMEPGAGGQATLTVRWVAGAAPDSAEAQSYTFEVICGTPGGKPEMALTCQGEYLVAARPPEVVFQAVLVPIAPSGAEGTYDIRLTNGGAIPLAVVLRGGDRSGLLTFTFAPPRVTLAARAEQVVRLTVRTNALEPLSEEHTYPFDVICWVPSANKAITLTGELLYISF